jgi:hypothetical protein
VDINFFDMLWGQMVNIPINNLLGTVYVIINAIMLVLGTVFAFSGEQQE